MLLDRCLSVCPVCDVGVLWPNGWMDQHLPLGMVVGLRPGHIVLDGDLAAPKGHNIPQFSTDGYGGLTAGCIEMPLGTPDIERFKNYFKAH